MAPDPWFSTYDSTCQIAQEIAEKIQQQNQYERNGENTIKLTMTIRTLLQNLKDKIALLKDLLLRAVSTRQITQLEGDRRQNLLDELVTRERLLVASFKNEGAEPDLIRSSLMTGGAKRGVPNPWLFEEPEETRGLGFDEIRQQQQKIIQEQDAGLDALSSIISRQKQMGKEIGNELDEQNGTSPSWHITVFPDPEASRPHRWRVFIEASLQRDEQRMENPALGPSGRGWNPKSELHSVGGASEIIDDLANLVENTDGKLRTETRRVNMVDRKSTSCGPDVLAALFLALVTFMWPLKIIMTKSVYRDRKMHMALWDP
ncbi:syntaxin-8 isoform X2 [Ursus maritimus]|uniref:Syntaxin-8 isoform X2 n=1 Tax=Ursus maritimus TaxID=29073 RepID=A0A8M1FRF4_URSMA|nr:syntaxin-8 isoform X2 [Ursus maritimus]